MKFNSWCFTFFFYLIAMLLIAWVDVVIGIQISLWIFYGIPVGLATWNFGRVHGTLIAIVSMVIVLLSVVICGHSYSSTGYLIIGLASKFLVYFVLVWLVGELRKKNVDRVFVPSKFMK
jgi:hypothetical protein